MATKSNQGTLRIQQVHRAKFMNTAAFNILGRCINNFDILSLSHKTMFTINNHKSLL